MSHIYTHLTPSSLEEAAIDQSTCVVIDILRASTTMVHALGQGAQAVIPCLNVEDAQDRAARMATSQRLLGGERHGKLIPGFDLDNSPFGYSADVVQGKTVLFTTTNGTRALWKSRAAHRILIGAFSNITALVEALNEAQEDVHLVCAGTDGVLTGEDVLFAGAVVKMLLECAAPVWKTVDLQSHLAHDYFSMRSRDAESFRNAFYESDGAQNLVELGMQRDIERAMERDLFDCVPRWNRESGELTIA